MQIFKINNLHVVEYSEPINKVVNFNELKEHVHVDKIIRMQYHTNFLLWTFVISKSI